MRHIDLSSGSAQEDARDERVVVHGGGGRTRSSSIVRIAIGQGDGSFLVGSIRRDHGSCTWVEDSWEQNSVKMFAFVEQRTSVMNLRPRNAPKSLSFVMRYDGYLFTEFVLTEFDLADTSLLSFDINWVPCKD